MVPAGLVVSLHVAATAASPVQTLDRVQAVVGLGLEGDRYFSITGTYSKIPGTGRQLTLIEIEAIEALQREYDLTIAPGQARRNVVTRGIALNHLVGREFFVGEARLYGRRLCEPCAHLEKLTIPGAMLGLIHRGRLRADILTGGAIRTGDPIFAINDHR